MKSHNIIQMATMALALALATATSVSADGMGRELVNTAADALVWSTVFQLSANSLTGATRYVGRLFQSLKPTRLQKQLGDQYCPANNPDLSCWFVPSTRILVITTSNRAMNANNHIMTPTQLQQLNALCANRPGITCGAGTSPDTYAISVSARNN